MQLRNSKREGKKFLAMKWKFDSNGNGNKKDKSNLSWDRSQVESVSEDSTWSYLN